MDADEKGLRDAIAKDRYDWTSRRVLADLLSEQGRDDEAAAQYAWTPDWQQTYDEAERFVRKMVEEILEEILEEIDDYDHEAGMSVPNGGDPLDARSYDRFPLTYEGFIEAGEAAFKNNASICLNFDTPVCFQDMKTKEKMWESLAILTGRTPDAEHKYFGCAC